jgi:D-glycero-alpha-D-manno-heptose-7-phosphate kinase
MRLVEKEAPCRVDLAGGTLDLWPLYLYFGKLELLHMGLNLKAKAAAGFDPDKAFSLTIESSDYGKTAVYPSMEKLAIALRKSQQANNLRWLCRVAEFFIRRSGKSGAFTLKTSSQVPPGSGLGGSSTLGIAMGQAFAELLGDPLAKDPWKLQQTIRDLEAVEIEHPAGDQDYVPALFGGLLVFKLTFGERSIEKLPASLAQEFASRAALIYTGKPHHSGLNNWDIFKAYHEGKKSVHTALGNIQRISTDMVNVFRAGDLHSFSALLNSEWKQRQLLSKAVNAPVLEKAWKMAQAAGAEARKACGAGGGGCLLVYFKDSQRRDDFLKTEVKGGWKIYPVEVGAKGVAP